MNPELTRTVNLSVKYHEMEHLIRAIRENIDIYKKCLDNGIEVDPVEVAVRIGNVYALKHLGILVGRNTRDLEKWMHDECSWQEAKIDANEEKVQECISAIFEGEEVSCHS